MRDIASIREDFLRGFEKPDLPQDFLEKYDLMECLANGHGTETFLVQTKACSKGADEGLPELFVAKCYDRKLLNIEKSEGSILSSLDHQGLPCFCGEFINDSTLCIVREYIDGMPLDQYAEANELTTQDAVDICIKLCGILEYIHTQTPPVIHRDIKPQNIVVRSDGSLALIDFDISRVFNQDAETDTQIFGTRNYAAPEQYGFMQTDARADVFSFGVLLRWLVTGSDRKNDNIRLYGPVQKIIGKCTAFSPEARYQNVAEVKKALVMANPRAQRMRAAKIVSCCVAAVCVLTFGGMKIYDYVTYTPFTDGHIPAYMTDEERVTDALDYVHETFDTDMFDASNEIATVGDMRRMLAEVCGLDKTYVWAMPTSEIPAESQDYFLPWGWDEGQTVDRDVAVYACVKAYWPDVVADWSSLKDDNGYYPGARIALDFAEEKGIMTGLTKPGDLTLGEMALVLANTHRVYTSTSEE